MCNRLISFITKNNILTDREFVMPIYAYFFGLRKTIILLNELWIIRVFFCFFLFRFEFLTAMDITFFWDVTPCNSVEGCHISKESGIFIFGFIILLHDALRIYSMHKDLLSLLVLLSSFFNYLFIYIYLYIFIYIYINYLMC